MVIPQTARVLKGYTVRLNHAAAHNLHACILGPHVIIIISRAIIDYNYTLMMKLRVPYTLLSLY